MVRTIYYLNLMLLLYLYHSSFFNLSALRHQLPTVFQSIYEEITIYFDLSTLVSMDILHSERHHNLTSLDAVVEVANSSIEHRQKDVSKPVTASSS